MRMLERGDMTTKEYFRELADDYDEEELDRILWSVATLCRSEACDQWMNAIPDRKFEDWMLMALDTAMIWERG